MPKGLPQLFKDHVDKCRASAIAAVDTYNRAGSHFRTAQYIVLITIAWTALFHAIFYRNNRRPWHRLRTSGTGKGVRYAKINGEPRHWELSECLKQYFVDEISAERKNLEVLIGLRNKIEHRHLPEFDATLYGECQAALLNLEELLAEEFGQKYTLSEQLAVSLQFSRSIPEQKLKALKTLNANATRSIKDYIETYRAGLQPEILNSMKYSFSVFLVPKVSNRESVADAAIEFVK